MVAGGAQVWHVHERSVAARELSELADSNGFVPVLTTQGSSSGTVIILAALNCPSAQAQRADALAARLSRMGIPNRRMNHYAISRITREQMPLIRQTNAVLTGEIPIVIVNDRAEANPTVDEVVAEYRDNTPSY